MKTWLRLSLVTLTVGGGFVGIVLIPSSFEPGEGVFRYVVTLIAVLMYTGVLVSGLMFVHDPGCTTPLLAALAVQIPSVSSPALLYEFSVGLKFVLTLSTPDGNTVGLHAGFAAWLGSTFRFDFAHDHPWGIGVNLVPLVLLIALLKSEKVGDSGTARALSATQR